MPEVQLVSVTTAEAGQKILQFLQRRVGKEVPKGALMKWIRKGHVRVNKGRVKPFDRIEEGDVVRIPPYHLADGATDALVHNAELSSNNTIETWRGKTLTGTGNAGDCEANGLDVLSRTQDVLVLHKPAGLPVQPGSGHADSIATRLKMAFRGADFCPAPAHRLDKNTSGILLVGLSYKGLRFLQDGFADGHAIAKEYLAWVQGRWDGTKSVVLEDSLAKLSQLNDSGFRNVGKPKDKVHAVGAGGKLARCSVCPVLVRDDASLLLVTLHTGRTHQIRVQLSTRGYPLVGDPKYGGPRCSQGLLLHAWRVTLPDRVSSDRVSSFPEETTGQQPDKTRVCYSVPPNWAGRYAVPASLPDNTCKTSAG